MCTSFDHELSRRVKTRDIETKIFYATTVKRR